MGSYFFEGVKKGELFEGGVIRGWGVIRGNTVYCFISFQDPEKVMMAFLVWTAAALFFLSVMQCSPVLPDEQRVLDQAIDVHRFCLEEPENRLCGIIDTAEDILTTGQLDILTGDKSS